MVVNRGSRITRAVSIFLTKEGVEDASTRQRKLSFPNQGDTEWIEAPRLIIKKMSSLSSSATTDMQLSTMLLVTSSRAHSVLTIQRRLVLCGSLSSRRV